MNRFIFNYKINWQLRRFGYNNLILLSNAKLSDIFKVIKKNVA